MWKSEEGVGLRENIKTRSAMAEQNPNGGGGKSDGQLLRCPHCAGPLTKEMETSHWTLSPLLRDSFSMIGSGFGGFTAIFYSYLHTRPVIKRWIKGPMWVQILVGAPPNMIFASVCAGLAGGSFPALAQLASSSYHAFVSSPPPPPPPPPSL